MHRLAVAVALLVVPSAAALPGSRELFPLQPGNEWTFENLRYGGVETLSVARGGATGTFRLFGFPGAPSLRVRWSAQTVQAWDAEDRRWEPFLRLGARAGTTYAVDLPQPLWSGVRVTVASRRATVYNPVQRRSYSGTVRLALRPNPELADAGVTGLWFAPRIGPVRWVEQSIAGPVAHALASARIGRRIIGNGS